MEESISYDGIMRERSLYVENKNTSINSTRIVDNNLQQVEILNYRDIFDKDKIEYTKICRISQKAQSKTKYKTPVRIAKKYHSDKSNISSRMLPLIQKQ